MARSAGGGFAAGGRSSVRPEGMVTRSTAAPLNATSMHPAATWGSTREACHARAEQVLRTGRFVPRPAGRPHGCAGSAGASTSSTQYPAPSTQVAAWT
jgi:hypothetical protein